jgi:hypothetical protein
VNLFTMAERAKAHCGRIDTRGGRRRQRKR